MNMFESPNSANFPVPTTYYVSAPCGSGKTFAATQYIKENITLYNFIYVAPTVKLLNQTKKRLEELGVSAQAVTSETCKGSVKRSIMRAIENTPDEFGTVLLITWNAYVGLPYFKRSDQWKILIDEVPNTDRYYFFSLPRQIEVLRKLIDLDFEYVNEKMHRAVLKNRPAVKRLPRKEEDDVEMVFRELLADLANPNKDVFVDNITMDCWKGDKKHRGEGGSNSLYFISMLNSRLFRNATLLAANVEESLVYTWLTAFHGVRFVEDQEICSMLRGTDANIGRRLKISYLIPGRHNSKSLHNKTLSNEELLIDEMDKLAVKEFGSENFLYVANADRASPSIDSVGTAQRIPVISYGLNDYSNYRNIYISCALNRPPKHFKMLEVLGLSPDQVHTAASHEMIYQCVMRTALRDPSSQVKVHAIVPDSFCANRLAALTGCTEVNRIGSLGIFRAASKESYTPVQKNQRMMAKRVLDSILDRRSLPDSYSSKDFGNDLGFELESRNGSGGTAKYDTDESCIIPASRECCPSLRSGQHRSEKEIEQKDSNIMMTSTNCGAVLKGKFNDLENNSARNSLGIAATLHGSKYDKLPSQHSVTPFSAGNFVKFMRLQSKAVRDDREEAGYYNAALFSPASPYDGYRKIEHFSQSSFMVLDFDNGSLSPECFEDIFWNKAGESEKRSFIICNTFSRSSEKPNKFRVILFYKRPAKTVSEHQAVFDALERRLKDHGYPPETSGLDKSACRSGVQSFFLPCTNRNNIDWAFFRTHGTRQREIERFGIDPEAVARTTCVKIQQKSTRRNVKTASNPEDVRDATQKLRTMKEGRHQEVFNAALTLAKRGLGAEEISREILGATDNTPHMQRKVKGAISSLKRYGKL